MKCKKNSKVIYLDFLLKRRLKYFAYIKHKKSLVILLIKYMLFISCDINAKDH